MKLGIGSYTLPWAIGVAGYETPTKPLTAQNLIEIAYSHGLTLVQIADNLPLHQMGEKELQALRALADQRGVSIEIGTRGTEPDHLQHYLRIAIILGSTLVRTLVTTEDLDQAEADLRNSLPEYAAAGVMLAIENHGLHKTDQLIDLIVRLDSSYVGICLDTVNSYGALESSDDVIDHLSPYVVNLHIKDYDIKRVDHQMGYVILGTPAGAGKLNVRKLLDSVNNQNNHTNAILELWTPYTHSVEQTIKLEQQWLNESLEYLKRFEFI